MISVPPSWVQSPEVLSMQSEYVKETCSEKLLVMRRTKPTCNAL